MQQDLLKTVEFGEPEPPLPSVRLSCLICSPGDEGWGGGGGWHWGGTPAASCFHRGLGTCRSVLSQSRRLVTPAAWGEAGHVVREDAGCVAQGGDSLSQLLAVPGGGGGGGV